MADSEFLCGARVIDFYYRLYEVIIGVTIGENVVLPSSFYECMFYSSLYVYS